jgi:hypothetical protein
LSASPVFSGFLNEFRPTLSTLRNQQLTARRKGANGRSPAQSRRALAGIEP